VGLRLTLEFLTLPKFKISFPVFRYRSGEKPRNKIPVKTKYFSHNIVQLI